MSAEPIIEFCHVQKAFGDHRVYTDLTLAIERGETLTIIGRSGIGKSVMLKLLIGLLRTDGGKILFEGRDLVPLREKDLLPVRRRISMLFQGAALFDSINVFDNVAYGLREHNPGISHEETAERVAHVLEVVGLPGIEEMRPADLSGGMKKRVALARAIAFEPDVILYDEPTTGLDPLNVRRIEGLIRDLQERMNVTSLVVTHDIESAFNVTNRIAMVDDGKVRALGTIDEIKNSGDEFLRRFIAGEVGED